MNAFADDFVTIHHGDCLDVMRGMEPCSIDAIVTDPPYGLGFMGRAWDHGVPGEPFWREALRVAKPGAHLVAFGGTRTFHRLACAIEDAGWEIRDCLGWLYSTGFPKSLNLDKTGAFCACERTGDTLPYDHERNSEQTPECDLRPVRDADVSSALDAGSQRGQVLFESVPEHGSPAAGRQESPAPVRSGESGVEGRRDVPEPPRELCERALPASADVGASDGAQGRLRNGAPLGYGDMGEPPTGADGVCASSRPRSAEQLADESGTVAGQPEPQTRGAWPLCGRCGKPQIPRGLGTALKPSYEPIILARKPLGMTVAACVQENGTGALNIDGCRVEWASDTEAAEVNQRSGPNARYAGVPESSVVGYGQKMPNAKDDKTSPLGRWPANIAHDGSDEVLAVFPQSAGQMADVPIATGPRKSQNAYGTMSNGRAGEPSAEKRYTDDGATNYAMLPGQRRGDAGSAARFFYCAKATTAERNDGLWDFEAKAPGAGSRNLTGDPLVDRIHGLNPKKNSHPTVKPVDLMRWLVRLITPPDGIVLDPFMGSGTTLIAARAEGHKSIGVDLEEAHCEIARGRMSQGVLL